MNGILYKCDSVIGTALNYLLCIFINSIVILMVIQILLRYIFDLPMKSIEELLNLPVIYLYFLGAVNATRTETHISARLLEVFCKNEKQIAVLRGFAAAVAIIVSMWFVYLSYDLIKYSLMVKKTSMMLHYPLLLIEGLPLVCFGLMTIYSIAETIKYYNIAVSKN